MKKSLIFFITIICWIIYQNAWAAPTFQYHITGITGPLLINVQAALNSAQPTAEQAPEIIRKALQPFGYFKPQIATSIVRQNNQQIESFIINSGPALRITKLDLQITGPGYDNPALQNLYKNFPLKVGQALETEAYDQNKQLLFNTAEQEGYITAQLTQHKIAIDLKSYTAIVILQLETGPRFFFGPTNFSPSPFKKEFLIRYSSYKQGDPYSTHKLVDFQTALNNSNYFQQVAVEPQREQTQNQQVPIAVKLTPRPAQQYIAGVGFGTDTGPRITLGGNWRYLTDTGQYFSMQLRLSRVQSILQAVYTIPGKNPSSDQHTINASVFENRLSQGSSLTKQIGVSSISSNGNWQRTISINYQIENFKFSGQSSQNSNLLIPGISWLYLNADNPIYTKNGQRFSIRIQGSNQTLLSTTSFLQTEIQDKYIYSFNENSRMLLRGDIGYTVVHNLNVFPLSMRFYAGGTQSIRGYNFQNLGPGRYLAVGSAEYQHKIFGNWSGAVFYDIGNAVNNFPLSFRRGVGTGVVWASPLGPLELTVAHGIGRPGHEVQLQFNMGPDLG